MKRPSKLLFAAGALLLGASLMTGCKGNDDDDLTVDNTKVAGTYNGVLSAKVMTVDCPFDGNFDVVIDKSKSGDQYVDIILPACSFVVPGTSTPQNIPQISVAKVEVKPTAITNVYGIDDTDFTVTVDGVTYTGEIEGSVTGKGLLLNYTLTPGKMPMPINFTFGGTLK